MQGHCISAKRKQYVSWSKAPKIFTRWPSMKKAGPPPFGACPGFPAATGLDCKSDFIACYVIVPTSNTSSNPQPLSATSCSHPTKALDAVFLMVPLSALHLAQNHPSPHPQAGLVLSHPNIHSVNISWFLFCTQPLET